MTPILVRPVREQLEHDRIIRILQAKFKRRQEVGITAVPDQPDLVLTEGAGRKALTVIEVETGESVNNLEAMAQWARFGRLKAPFHLYIPSGSVESARRLCQENHINVAEIWSYHAVGDQVHFAVAYRRAPAEGRARSAAGRSASRGRARQTAAVKRKPVARPKARRASPKSTPKKSTRTQRRK